MNHYRTLTDEQVQSFMTKGYLVVHDCIDKTIAKRWLARGYERLGYAPDDPSTWTKGIQWMHCESEIAIRDIAPRAWEAVLDVIGGEDRLETRTWRAPENLYPVNSFKWYDAFIPNFFNGADKPWQPPSAQVGGWHKDGGYFRHFLDSPEQGLLTLVLWTDLLHQGGGTFIAPDSVGVVARYLLSHPEGFMPEELPPVIEELIKQCHEFEEITGQAGDFVVIHPYMLHASSQNTIRRPRFITNPPVVLKEPLNFNRPNPDDYSLVERATLHALGAERVDFSPAVPREQQWTAWPD